MRRKTAPAIASSTRLPASSIVRAAASACAKSRCRPKRIWAWRRAVTSWPMLVVPTTSPDASRIGVSLHTMIRTPLFRVCTSVSLKGDGPPRTTASSSSSIAPAVRYGSKVAK